MPPTQDSQNTFKPNLTCTLLSARAWYIISNPDGRPCILQTHLWIWGYKDWPSPSFSSHLNPIHRCACSIEVLPYLQLTAPHHSVILQKFRNIWQHWTNKRQNRTVSLCGFIQNGQWTIFWQVHYSYSMDKPPSFSLESLKFHNRPFSPVFHDE